MAPPITDTTLDAILAMQLTVAWAGEARCTPKRLGWWETDLIDEVGGGDLLRRLLPKTGAWAALEAVREAARRVDAKSRGQMADPDKLRTIFFLGFEIDEQLGDRLGALKRSGQPVDSALKLPVPLTADFSASKLEGVLRAGEASYATTPTGRQIKGKLPDEPDVLVRRLASALLPFAPAYPLPFYKHEV